MAPPCHPDEWKEPKLLVRRANAADIPAIMALERHCLTAAHWMPAEYQRIFTAGQTPRIVLVAEEEPISPPPGTPISPGGEVLGFLVVRVLGPDWEIENVAVAPSARRQGLATHLMHAVMDLARNRGATSVYLEVRESNDAARNLYEKLKFVRTGLRKSYYSNPIEDGVVYQFRFSESR